VLFNSTTFLQFFAAFLLLYWVVRRHLVARNVLVVAASYLFYGWWDWRFLGLLVFSSLTDFAVGLALGRTESPVKRRRWLWFSLGINLGVLGAFKYFGFFLDSLHALLAGFGVESPSWSWNIILPVGISFYTFQTLGYTLDVYRRQLEPTRDWLAFLAYVSFFPQLVAGPIERAAHLLPQFQQTRTITRGDLREGLWLVLWGMFKKVVVADSLAPLVELAFDRGVDSGPVVLLGTLAFAGQIYGDFSGYSDIARGLARLLGFDLMLNFNLPYLATSLREFWRRWHISLSTWLRDYLYLPLGGSRSGGARTALNLLVTMLLGGLWHGAAWNFVCWGALHGAGLVAERWLGEAPPRGRRREEVDASEVCTVPPPHVGGYGVGRRFAGWLLTMVVVLYGWLLFRGGDLAKLSGLHAALVNWAVPVWFGTFSLQVLLWLLPLGLMQLWQARANDLLAPLKLPFAGRAALQGVLLAAIILCWRREAPAFIYFQF